MKKLALYFFIFLSLTTLFSCGSSIKSISTDSAVNYIPYYSKVYEADSLFLCNKYEKSYKILDSLFKKYEPLQLENLNEYSTYIATSAIVGKVENFEEKLRIGYSKYGGIGFFHPKSDSIREIINKFNPITIEEKKNLRQLYIAKFDPTLRDKILKMSIDDQTAREYPLDENKMKLVDERHKKMIVDIFKKDGYPSYQVIGKMGTFGEEIVQFMVIFMHQDYNFKKKHLNSLNKLMKQGKLSPEEYAIIVDRTYLEKKKSIYGMIQQNDIKYPKNINSIRKKIGLKAFRYEQWKDSVLNPDLYQKK